MKTFEERWEVTKRGNQKVLLKKSEGGYRGSGIDITVNKKAKTLLIGGWYDSFVGIESQEITLQEIIDLFKRENK